MGSRWACPETWRAVVQVDKYSSPGAEGTGRGFVRKTAYHEEGGVVGLSSWGP